MNNRVAKASKGRRFGIIAVIALMISCIQPVFADGEYTIYNIHVNDTQGDEYHATTATSQSDYHSSSDPLVYCLNKSKTRPAENAVGNSGYTKTSSATDTQIKEAIVEEDNAKYIRAVLYYGYPNFGNNNEWKTTYESGSLSLTFPTETYLQRIYTQAAIWYFTDNYSGVYNTPAYTLAAIAKQKIDANANAIPSDFHVDLYTSSDVDLQNFIGLASEETSETTIKVSVKVNKTWGLTTTGGTYSGTKPEVTFTLYEGEGTTTGTSYGPLTLGEDGTVTFSEVYTTTVKKFTLVENINDTVTGYTFTPIANQTIDLTNVTNGSTYEVSVSNTVTQATQFSVKVTKTWELTTGGTYSGTKPEVTFTLYGGEGTAGTNYGTVSLGEDDTAVFENIDVDNHQNFTLVENISGTVSGYTFSPCANIVLDIDDLSSDNELAAEAVNEVTPMVQEETPGPDEGSHENNNKNAVPDTGVRPSNGLYLIRS